MGLHARRPARRVLLRAGLTITALGAALGGGAAAAQAAPSHTAPASEADSTIGALTDAAGPALTGALGYSLAGALMPVTDMQLDPLAGTGVDPLDNAVGTQIADFQPVTTAVLTDPLTSGGALNDLPLVGQVTGLVTSALPGTTGPAAG
ncbi:hypothetical protein [Streptomyces sp. BE147]|uniref:hypothetical protein n=1 Tax=unclassified Streptomyces TaxID=2593676 RepID=UPI002E77F2C2|nr:hypothetical protein [Streptomyces sp. BE147]MEE1741864.1 hypothetical protein [Streptomyces sp. BE147]